MKILLDENLPAKLKIDFGSEHTVSTVRDMAWLGKRNGELLGLMISAGFDGFVTIDKNLRYQQNLDKLSITIFVLNAPNNRLDTLKPYVENLIRNAAGSNEKGIILIDIS